MNFSIGFYILSISSLIIFIVPAIVSIKEKEKLAAKRFLISSIIFSLPFLLLSQIEFEYRNFLFYLILTVILILAIYFLLPNKKYKYYLFDSPKGKIDERDTMFSRNELEPGSLEFEDYYSRNSDKKLIDDEFRTKPGLLSKDSSQYNAFQYASSNASFETIAKLKQFVDGDKTEDKINTDPAFISNYIKNWSRKLGALDCGITELKDYHIYSVGGRGDRYGKEINNNHQFGIAFTVEMDHEMVSSAPSGTIVMESGQQYLESGKIALQVANFIRSLGYNARAHIDGNYQVVCPLVARDAGLGEIGRMGLLMTPKNGPRVRLSVVTTDLPLIIDNPMKDASMIEFCELCKKCADNCPSKAISNEDMKEINGVNRWQINSEACFSFWCVLGTDCGMCMKVCPYSHPNNLMHNTVRLGIKKSRNFAKLALKLDDLFYGRKPKPAKKPKWMRQYS